MMLVIQDILFARLDHPDRGTPADQRHATECLLPNHLYRIEVVEQEGIRRIETKASDVRTLHRTQRGEEWNDTRIVVALKGVKYWWPAEMFSFFDADGKRYDLRLMRTATATDKSTYYKGAKIK